VDKAAIAVRRVNSTIALAAAAAAATSVYLGYELSAMTAALGSVANRLANSEAVSKCIEKFKREELEVDAAWWRQAPKTVTIKRGVNLYPVEFWQFRNPFWKEQYLNAHVTILAMEHQVHGVVCIYDISDGHVARAYQSRMGKSSSTPLGKRS